MGLRTDFAAQLLQAEAVSFDLFDTLVERRGLFSPKDLFYRVEEEAKRHLGGGLDGFAVLRVRAEEIARVRARGRGREEVTLDDIYAELSRLLSLDPSIAQRLQQIELDCERSAITPLSRGGALFDAAVATGKPVVILSDSYLGEDFVAEIVEQSGYGDASHVYVSSTYGKTKLEGSLYDIALKGLQCAPGKLLHVGDNQLSDVTTAVRKGIRTFLVSTPKHRLRWRHGVSDMPSGSLVLSKMLCEIGDRSERADPGHDSQSVLAQTAIQNLSLLFFSFAAWLVQQLRNGGHERVYFASRDGLVMKRFFDAVAAAAEFEIDSRYLYVSRLALYPSLIFTEPETARGLFVRSWDRLTIEDALQRISLTSEELAGQLGKHRLGYPGLELDPVAAPRFSALLGEIWPLVEKRNKKRYDLLREYLSQELVLSEARSAFVDIGWHGSLQNSLLQLLRHLGVANDLRGFYLGTFQEPFGVTPDFRATGFLVDNGEPASNYALVQSGPSLLELFHSADHGCVLGYERDGGRVVPVLEGNPVEQSQFARIIKPLQDQAFAFVSDRLERCRGSVIGAPDPGLVARLALRVVYDPTEDEARIFGPLQFASDFGGPMKSITGALEWDLTEIRGDTLPDDTRPIWVPGFRVLRDGAEIQPAED